MTDKERLERVDVIVEELYNNKFRLRDFVHNAYVNYECLRELEIREEKILKINQNEMQYRGEIESKCIELTEQNKRYRESIKKALEEEEQNLEGYQSTVHKILTETLEELE